MHPWIYWSTDVWCADGNGDARHATCESANETDIRLNPQTAGGRILDREENDIPGNSIVLDCGLRF